MLATASKFRVALFALVLCGITACGGGSSASFSSSFSTSLYLDGAAGIDAEITGILASARLETPTGELGDELLATETELALARRDGTGELVALRGIGPGPWSALVLRFADGSLRARRPAAPEVALAPGAHVMRVPFAAPWQGSASTTALALRHLEPVAPQPVGALLDWRPETELAPVDVVPLRFALVDVLRVDRAARTAIGSLVGMDARQVTLEFAEDALLLREPSPDPLGLDAFLAGLDPGARLVVDGFLDAEDRLVVLAAIDRGASEQPGQGQKGRLRAAILELVPGGETFRAAVLEVQKGSWLLPEPQPVEILVDASDARIRWSPRRGRHAGHLPFSALARGMIVELEWHGQTSGAPLLAEKIAIREQGTCIGRDFAGEVIAVTAEPPTLALRLREPVLVDGRELREIEFAIDEATPIVRTDARRLRLVRLDEIVTGEPARVLADPRGRGRLRADLVVLGWR